MSVFGDETPFYTDEDEREKALEEIKRRLEEKAQTDNGQNWLSKALDFAGKVASQYGPQLSAQGNPVLGGLASSGAVERLLSGEAEEARKLYRNAPAAGDIPDVLLGAAKDAPGQFTHALKVAPAETAGYLGGLLFGKGDELGEMARKAAEASLNPLDAALVQRRQENADADKALLLGSDLPDAVKQALAQIAAKDAGTFTGYNAMTSMPQGLVKEALTGESNLGNLQAVKDALGEGGAQLLDQFTDPSFYTGVGGMSKLGSGLLKSGKRADIIAKLGRVGASEEDAAKTADKAIGGLARAKEFIANKLGKFGEIVDQPAFRALQPDEWVERIGESRGLNVAAAQRAAEMALNKFTIASDLAKAGVPDAEIAKMIESIEVPTKHAEEWLPFGVPKEAQESLDYARIANTEASRAGKAIEDQAKALEQRAKIERGGQQEVLDLGKKTAAKEADLASMVAHSTRRLEDLAKQVEELTKARDAEQAGVVGKLSVGEEPSGVQSKSLGDANERLYGARQQRRSLLEQINALEQEVESLRSGETGRAKGVYEAKRAADEAKLAEPGMKWERELPPKEEVNAPTEPRYERDIREADVGPTKATSPIARATDEIEAELASLRAGDPGFTGKIKEAKRVRLKMLGKASTEQDPIKRLEFQQHADELEDAIEEASARSFQKAGLAEAETSRTGIEERLAKIEEEKAKAGAKRAARLEKTPGDPEADKEYSATIEKLESKKIPIAERHSKAVSEIKAMRAREAALEAELKRAKSMIPGNVETRTEERLGVASGVARSRQDREFYESLHKAMSQSPRIPRLEGDRVFAEAMARYNANPDEFGEVERAFLDSLVQSKRSGVPSDPGTAAREGVVSNVALERAQQAVRDKYDEIRARQDKAAAEARERVDPGDVAGNYRRVGERASEAMRAEKSGVGRLSDIEEIERLGTERSSAGEGAPAARLAERKAEITPDDSFRQAAEKDPLLKYRALTPGEIARVGMWRRYARDLQAKRGDKSAADAIQSEMTRLEDGWRNSHGGNLDNELFQAPRAELFPVETAKEMDEVDRYDRVTDKLFDMAKERGGRDNGYRNIVFHDTLEVLRRKEKAPGYKYEEEPERDPYGEALSREAQRSMPTESVGNAPDDRESIAAWKKRKADREAARDEREAMGRSVEEVAERKAAEARKAEAVSLTQGLESIAKRYNLAGVEVKPGESVSFKGVGDGKAVTVEYRPTGRKTKEDDAVYEKALDGKVVGELEGDAAVMYDMRAHRRGGLDPSVAERAIGDAVREVLTTGREPDRVPFGEKPPPTIDPEFDRLQREHKIVPRAELEPPVYMDRERLSALEELRAKTEPGEAIPIAQRIVQDTEVRTRDKDFFSWLEKRFGADEIAKAERGEESALSQDWHGAFKESEKPLLGEADDTRVIVVEVAPGVKSIYTVNRLKRNVVGKLGGVDAQGKRSVSYESIDRGGGGMVEVTHRLLDSRKGGPRVVASEVLAMPNAERAFAPKLRARVKIGKTGAEIGNVNLLKSLDFTNSSKLADGGALKKFMSSLVWSEKAGRYLKTSAEDSAESLHAALAKAYRSYQLSDERDTAARNAATRPQRDAQRIDARRASERAAAEAAAKKAAPTPTPAPAEPRAEAKVPEPETPKAAEPAKSPLDWEPEGGSVTVAQDSGKFDGHEITRTKDGAYKVESGNHGSDKVQTHTFPTWLHAYDWILSQTLNPKTLKGMPALPPGVEIKDGRIFLTYKGETLAKAAGVARNDAPAWLRSYIEGSGKAASAAKPKGTPKSEAPKAAEPKPQEAPPAPTPKAPEPKPEAPAAPKGVTLADSVKQGAKIEVPNVGTLEIVSVQTDGGKVVSFTYKKPSGTTAKMKLADLEKGLLERGWRISSAGGPPSPKAEAGEGGAPSAPASQTEGSVGPMKASAEAKLDEVEEGLADPAKVGGEVGAEAVADLRDSVGEPLKEDVEDLEGSRRAYGVLGVHESAERYAPTVHRVLQKASNEEEKMLDSISDRFREAGVVEKGSVESKRIALFVHGVIDKDGKINDAGRSMNERIEHANTELAEQHGGEAGIPEGEKHRRIEDDYGALGEKELALAKVWKDVSDELFRDLVNKNMIDPSKHRENYISFIFDKDEDPLLVRSMLLKDARNQIENVYGRPRMSELDVADLDFVRSVRGYIPIVVKKLAYEPKLRGLMEITGDLTNESKITGGFLKDQYEKDVKEVGKAEADRRLQYAKHYVVNRVSGDPEALWENMSKKLDDMGVLEKFAYAPVSATLATAQRAIARYALGGNVASATRNLIGGQMNILLRATGGYEHHGFFGNVGLGIADYIRGIVRAASEEGRALSKKEGVARDYERFLESFLPGKANALIRVMDKILFKPFRMVEAMNRGVAFHVGTIRSLRNQGFGGTPPSKVPEAAMKKALTDGHRFADETQFLYGTMHASPYNKVPQPLKQFAEFPVMQTKLYLDSALDAIDGLKGSFSKMLKGDLKGAYLETGKMSGLASYAVAVGALSLLMDRLGLSSSFLYDAVTPLSGPIRAIMDRVRGSAGESLPGSDRGFPMSPIVDLVFDVAKDGNYEKALGQMLSFAIPAGLQVQNLLRAKRQYARHGNTQKWMYEGLGETAVRKLLHPNQSPDYTVVHGDWNDPPLSMNEMIATAIGMRLSRDVELSQMGEMVRRQRAIEASQRTDFPSSAKKTRIYNSTSRDYRRSEDLERLWNDGRD